ncbi:MAG: ATP-binding domain-containing protein [Sandaracinaceae bacterium]|nr:ATP-binding domain-containing protein [Sandaracinaceae bacterium]
MRRSALLALWLTACLTVPPRPDASVEGDAGRDAAPPPAPPRVLELSAEDRRGAAWPLEGVPTSPLLRVTLSDAPLEAPPPIWLFAGVDADDLREDLAADPLRASSRARIVGAALEGEGPAWTIVPEARLARGEALTVGVGAWLRGASSGLRMGEPFVAALRVSVDPAAGAAVTDSWPPDGASAVPPSIRELSVRFDGPVDGLRDGVVVLEPDGTMVPSIVRPFACDAFGWEDGLCAVLAPDRSLAPSTAHRLVVGEAVLDATGAPVGPWTARFTTSAEGEDEPPALLALPCALDEVTIDAGCVLADDGRVVLRISASEPVRATLSIAGRTVREVAPRGTATLAALDLPPDTELAAVLRLEDLGGNVVERALSLRTTEPLLSLAIVEVRADPLGTEPRQEYVEVLNFRRGRRGPRGHLHLGSTRLGGRRRAAAAAPRPGAARPARRRRLRSGGPGRLAARPPGVPLVRVGASLATGGITNAGEALYLRDGAMRPPVRDAGAARGRGIVHRTDRGRPAGRRAPPLRHRALHARARAMTTQALPFGPPRERADEIVQGTVLEVRFASPDGRFAVLRVQREANGEEIAVVGDVAGLAPGEDVRFRGRWEEHERFGGRFRAVGFTPVLPTNKQGLERFLGSGLIPGIGKQLAKRLVDRFGDRTLDVITTQSARLREVPGIGKQRAEAIAEAVRARRAEAENLSFLHSLGLGPALSRKLLKKYGPRTVQVLKDDPYLAAEEVPGVGFKTADQIGRAAGIGPDDPRRAAGAVLHLVGRAADEGHVFLPREELRERAARLEVPAELVDPAIDQLAARELLVCEEDRVYAPPLFRAEVRAAEPPRAAGATASRARRGPREAAPPRAPLRSAAPRGGHRALERPDGAHGRARHRQDHHRGGHRAGPRGPRAARAALRADGPRRQAHERGERARGHHHPPPPRVEPGHGQLLARRRRAARRRPRAGRRGLDARPHAGARAPRGHPPAASLVLVGDVDQLPPVGAGQVLRELIASERAPVVRLDTVFRQAQRSAIVRGAHAILAGRLPSPTPRGEKGPGDLFLVRAGDADAIGERLASTLRRIPEAYGLDARRDVQVLVPMRKGPLGTERLNALLQAELNPASARGAGLRPGDKVMQLRNDYEREVFNGDIGWVQRVEDGVTYVTFDSGLRSYKADELDALTLAYASTIHKAQGSEFPAVVVVLHGAHSVLLSRALVYTAVTRARRLVVIVGDERALARAARTVGSSRAFCRLAERLREA